MLDDMFDAYGKLLEDLANDEKTWELNQVITLPKKQEQNRVAYNDTFNPNYLPKEDDLLSAFFKHVKNSPSKNALITTNEELSYKQLYNRSCFIAWHLKEANIKPLDRVAVILPKGWQQISSVIATLGVNAIYIPFDYNLPQKRLLQLVDVANISHIISFEKMKDDFSFPKDITFINAPLNWTEKEEQFVQNNNIELKKSNNQDLAYIIYTSGSTGTPKGVMVNHKSALNTILDINDRFNVTINDVVFGLSGLHFDLSVYDIFGTLSAGACLVLPDENSTKDPSHWIMLLTKYKISIWNSVPALCEMLLIQANSNKTIIENMRLVLLSGDWIPLRLKEELEKSTKNAKLYSLGGATEASIWSIYHPVEETKSSWSSIPYGKPLANQQFYVLNEKLNNCPELVEGDLYIGGEGLAKGYWLDEQKTKEAFILHPETGKKLYKTGDKGRFNSNGYIEFLGRNDFQVKINGYRIELGEIEASLLKNKSIQNVVVTAIDDFGNNEISRNVKNNKQKLIAYCVCKDTKEKGIETKLKIWLEERLPNYMIPNHFFILDKIPLSNNGKVDRKALPLPNEDSTNDKNNEPKTSNEELIVSLCKDILKLDTFNINSNFFDIGGDSLQATKLSVSFQQQGFNLSVNQIFTNPILKDMAKAVKIESHLANMKNENAIEFNNSSSILTSLNVINDEKRNMFCIHGSDGDIFVFNELANQLEDDFNIYGIGAQETIEKDNIIDIAQSYLEQIKAKEASKAPIICGFSSGGFIAWEIAKQLEEMGEDLTQLILIDTQFLPQELKDNSLLILVLFAYTFNMDFDVLPIKKELIQKLMNSTYSSKELSEIQRLDEEEFESLFEKLITSNKLNTQKNTLRQKYNIFKQYVEFSIDYDIPQLSSIETLLLKAKQSSKGDLIWKNFDDKIQHIEVDGNHMSCLQYPFVSSLSNTIQNFSKK